MERKELITAIKRIKPGLTRDNVVELAEFISFNDTEIVSYNNEVSISYPYDTGLFGAVKGDELLRILQSMPDDIVIETKKEKLVISKKSKGNKIKAELNMLTIQADLWPAIPEKFEPLPKNFTEGIKFCLFSVAVDPSMGPFNCILIEDNTILSCDNYRATLFELSETFDNSILIPLSLAKVLVNYNVVSYTQDDSWLYFEDEYGIIICCKKVEMEYIKEVYDLFEVEGEVIKLPAEFTTSLARSEILSNTDIENQKSVKLELSKNKIVISSGNDTGQYQEEVKTDYSGKDITISVNPIHMNQIIKDCSEFTLTDSSIIFKTDTFDHLIKLMAE